MGKRLNLSIDGMHCAACVRRVKDALCSVDGVEVESVEIGSETVLFEPARVSPQYIVAAVNRIGFTAGDVSRVGE